MTPREIVEAALAKIDSYALYGIPHDIARLAITEAIAATREEDARIADHYAQSMIGLPGGASPHNAALNIAALIRKAQPTTGGTE